MYVSILTHIRAHTHTHTLQHHHAAEAKTATKKQKHRRQEHHHLFIALSFYNNNNNWLQHPDNTHDQSSYLTNKTFYLSNKRDKVIEDVLRARLWCAKCDQPYVGHFHMLVVLFLRFPPPEYGVFSGCGCYMLSVYRFRVGFRFCGEDPS